MIPALSDAIENKQWNTICNNHYDIKEFNIDGKVALYRACIKNAPQNVIEFLYNSYPDAAFIRDKNSGWTPLHCSVANNFAEEVIIYLNKVAPSAAFIANDFGNTPLHSALLRRLSFKVIKALADSTNKSMTSVVNYRGESPLETFLMVWFFSIKTFLQSIPDSLSPHTIMDMEIIRSGQTYSIQYIYSVASLLFSQSFKEKRKSCFDLNDAPNLLHLVLELESCPWIFYEFFMHLHPEQMNETDTNGTLPIVLLAQKSRKSIHDKLFKCSRCKRLKSTLYDMHGSQFCTSCSANMTFDVNEFTVAKRDDEVEKVQTVYKLLRECPSIFAIA